MAASKQIRGGLSLLGEGLKIGVELSARVPSQVLAQNLDGVLSMSKHLTGVSEADEFGRVFAVRPPAFFLPSAKAWRAECDFL